MSVLAQLYGEAKGIEKSLDTMNKSLKQMQAQDRKSNQQEEKFRQEILKYKRRERADQQRNQDFFAETMDNAIGKKAGKNMMGGGLLAALAAGLGVAVASSLAGKGLFGGGEDSKGAPGGAAPPSGGGGGSQTETETPAQQSAPDVSLKNPFRNRSEDTRSATPEQQKKADTGENIRDTARVAQGVSSALKFSRFLPGSSQVIGGAATGLDLAAGDYLGATLGGGSMLPGPAGWAFTGLDILYDLSKSQDKRDKENLLLMQRLKEAQDAMSGSQAKQSGGFTSLVGTNEQVQAKQSGGFTGLVPSLGQPTTGDHFYTSVAPGSYIMNRNLVDAMGYQSGGVPVALEAGEVALPPGSYDKASMDYLNHVAFPRFQEGGLVEADHPHTGSGYSIGKDYKGRPSVFSKEAAEALMKAIQASDGAVKASDITSSKRSVEHNSRVGGVANSNHLSGNAVDIHGTSKAWLKEHGPKYGWHNLNYSGHDGHFDFKGGGSSGAPQRTGGDVKEKTEKTASTKGKEGGGGIVSEFGGFGEFGKAASAVMQGILASMPASLRGIFSNEFGGGDGNGGGDNKRGGGPKKVGANDMMSGASPLGSGGGTLTDLSDKQWSDLAYIVSSEAARGTDDIYGVAANVLTRVADPAYPSTIMGVGTQAGQYEAVYKGMAVRDEKLAAKLKENSSKIAEALQVLNGRTDFKGQTMLNNKGASDPMFHSSGNFYHYSSQRGKNDPVPESPPQHWKQWLGQQRGGAVKYMKGGNVLANNLQELNENFKMQMMSSQEPIVIYEDADDGGISATMSGGADNNDPFFLPTRSTSWASAIMEFRERTFNQGY